MKADLVQKHWKLITAKSVFRKKLFKNQVCHIFCKDALTAI